MKVKINSGSRRTRAKSKQKGFLAATCEPLMWEESEAQLVDPIPLVVSSLVFMNTRDLEPDQTHTLMLAM